MTSPTLTPMGKRVSPSHSWSVGGGPALRRSSLTVKNRTAMMLRTLHTRATQRVTGTTEPVDITPPCSQDRFPRRSCDFLQDWLQQKSSGSRDGQPMHRLLKHPPAMLIALKLIKASASRSQQNNVARNRRLAGASNRVFQSLRVINFGRSPNLR